MLTFIKSYDHFNSFIETTITLHTLHNKLSCVSRSSRRAVSSVLHSTCDTARTTFSPYQNAWAR